MNEITKELLDALKDTLDFVERHSNRWDGANGKHPHTVVEAAHAAIAKAETILTAPQPAADAVEAAFREGFRSPTTYNDTVMNSEDDAWENSEARAEAAKAAPQPSAYGWIPWEGGECPVGGEVIVAVKDRDGDVDNYNKAHLYDWRHEGNRLDIIAYRVVKP